MKPKPDSPTLPIRARRRLLLLDAALLLGAPAAAAPAPGLRAVTLMAPLFGMEQQGKASGIFVDVMGELARASGIAIDNTMAPKVRGQIMLEIGNADLMIGFDNPDLLAHARHVAPVASFEVGIVARAGIRLRSLSDLHGLTVGQLRGADYSQAYARDAAILKYDTSTMAQILQMLALGRVDAAIGVRESLYYGMRAEGIAPQRVGDFLALESRRAWLHYANATYNAALAQRLAEALQRMQAAGTISAIIARNAGDGARTAKR